MTSPSLCSVVSGYSVRGGAVGGIHGDSPLRHYNALEEALVYKIVGRRLHINDNENEQVNFTPSTKYTMFSCRNWIKDSYCKLYNNKHIPSNYLIYIREIESFFNIYNDYPDEMGGVNLLCFSMKVGDVHIKTSTLRNYNRSIKKYIFEEL